MDPFLHLKIINKNDYFMAVLHKDEYKSRLDHYYIFINIIHFSYLKKIINKIFSWVLGSVPHGKVSTAQYLNVF